MDSFFSIGILVEDLPAARVELGSALGVQFGEPVRAKVLGWDLTLCFSLRPPWLELIEGPPDGPWSSGGGPRLDHLCWWSDDVVADTERLVRMGGRIEADGTQLATKFVYVRLPETNLRVELIEASTKSAFHQRWGLEEPLDATAAGDAGDAPFQAGIVVNSLEAAMAELTEAIGTRWGTLVEIPQDASVVRVAFGDPGPHLELIQRDGGPPPGLDHLGWWSDDLSRDTARIQSAGATLVLDGSEFGQPIRLFGPMPAAGISIELCGTSQQDGFRTAWGLPG